MTIKDAMVLAAGLGTRMRPITDTIPKPLVAVAGKTLLDYALDALAAANVENAVINVHYLADHIEVHTSTRDTPRIYISDERAELLDSGGGVKKAIGELPDLQNGSFIILNADSFWIDTATPALQAMSDFWDDDTMDMMLLVSPKESAVGFDGKGDFFIDTAGRLARRGDADAAPLIYAGAIIAKPQQFRGISEAKFSLNRFFDDAIEKGRLFGFTLDGLWLHVGTPQAIGEAETAIENFTSQQQEKIA